MTDSWADATIVAQSISAAHTARRRGDRRYCREGQRRRKDGKTMCERCKRNPASNSQPMQTLPKLTGTGCHNVLTWSVFDTAGVSAALQPFTLAGHAILWAGQVPHKELELTVQGCRIRNWTANALLDSRWRNGTSANMATIDVRVAWTSCTCSKSALQCR